MMKHVSRNALAAVFLAAVVTSGCGLKGALTLPSKSDEVVIRTPGQTAPVEGEPPATPRKDDRIPPPPLPGGNPGTARGG
jgi:predicted small lipoprotein YifL